MSRKSVNPKIKAKASQATSKGAHTADVKKKIPRGPRPAKTPKPVKVVKPVADNRWLPVILMAFLFVFVSLLYFPVAFRGESPQASDISQWRGAANQIIEYNETHPDNALWTQNMFSGMPAYMISFPNRFPFLENISKLTDKLINWRIFLLFLGALGMFLLLRFLKLDPWISFLGAVAFMFSCHWLGLAEIGHNTKFRAMMYVPWVVWALMYLRKKPGLLGLGFLATMLIVQLRENHPQISYYLYLFVGMYWIWQLITSIRKKELKRFGIFTALLVLAFGLTLLAVMNPYLSTMEYSRHTMRGGAAGLETSYAQGWSFHPLEILTFLIPDFYGGVSPDYWGYMPFTQIYNYFGLLVLTFGVIALFGKKHRQLAIFLAASSFIFLIMSFGNFAPALSDLLLKYLPYFNKFRVPSMILIMVQFNAVILATLGVDTVIHYAAAEDKRFSKGLLKAFWICGGVFLLWLLAAKSVFAGLSFTTAQEMAQLEQYEAMSRLPELQAARLGMLYKSGILSLFLLTVGMGLAWLHSIKKLPRVIFVVILTLLVFTDLFVYTGKHLRSENLRPPREHEQRFAPRDYDEYLLASEGNFRVYPVSSNILTGDQLPRPAGEWAYHHQIVTGYSAAKLKRYDDVLKVLEDSPLGAGEWRRYLIGVFAPPEGEMPREISTPILDMLSVKYILHPGRLPYDSLLTRIKPVYDGSSNVSIYQNERALPRAWFVERVQKVTPADSIPSLLRSGDFDPARLAYVESDMEGVAAPDSAWVSQTKSGMHELAYDLYTDKPAFLVLSEIYYPAGWKAFLDGEEIPIYPANYILRGLKIPAGRHELKLVFAPESYKKSTWLSLAGLLLSLAALVAGLIHKYIKRKPRKAEG
jgi:hypothetical protein